ncbi:MAG: hypothetical protein ACRD8U_02020, partial [Pyrinomonadaceae bacterium]
MKGYLGTNYGHGSAAALVSEQGDLLFAVEEGKLVGQKDAWQFPDASLRLIAEFQDIRITAWAEGWNAWHRLAHKGLLRTLKYGM